MSDVNLLTLPEDVLIIIIKLLDINSVHNLYETCSRMKGIICFYRVVKKCKMSCSRMASAHYLHISFFKNIAFSIEELNLACVHNLNRRALLPVMKSLRSLRAINVSYTNISIIDFIHIFDNCPTISEVTIDSIFNKINPSINQVLSKHILLKCQDVFQNFKRIHFIGSFSNLLHNTYTLFMLQKTKNIILQYTISSLHKVLYTRFDCNLQPINFDKMFIVNVNTEHNMESLMNHFPREIDKQTEYILLKMSKTFETKFFCTPLFQKFFQENFNQQPTTTIYEHDDAAYKTLTLLFNKNTNVFNDNFFRGLLKQLQPYFFYHIHLHENEQVPPQYERFYVQLEEPLLQNLTNSNDGAEPIEVRHPNIVIDYDNIFKNKDKIHLSMFFRTNHIKIAFSPTCNFLSKLTYLSLRGSAPYNARFFYVLFQYCFKLETLNYEDYYIVNNIFNIAQAIPLSKSIKNVRLVGKGIDYKTLINFLSQCYSLENLHIVELNQESFEINDYELLVKNCNNLYCLYLYASVSENNRHKQLIALNTAKLKYKQHHLTVEVINGNRHSNFFEYVFHK